MQYKMVLIVAWYRNHIMDNSPSETTAIAKVPSFMVLVNRFLSLSGLGCCYLRSERSRIEQT